jgi:hypothetical protein
MIGRYFTPGGHLFGAYFFCQRATGAETTARRRVHRAGHVSFQYNPMAFFLDKWVWHRHSRE